MKTTFFYSFFLIAISMYSQKSLNKDAYSENIKYIGFKSTETVSADSVKWLLINCDKIDSLDRRLTKYRNLESLEITPCSYRSAYSYGVLNERDRIMVEENKKRDDEYNKNRKPDPRYTCMPFLSAWDSLYFENKILWVSPEIYDLKNIKSISIGVYLNPKAKRFLKRYRRKTKVSIYVLSDPYNMNEL